MLLADVNTPLIVAALEERWASQPATGPRVAQRIASVFAWAMARQLREPPNPADWSVLSRALATPTRREPAHHAAMDWKALPGFFAELQRREGVAARALEFTILTAARTGKALGALWSEFSDLDGAAPTWTIPPVRMKAGREHRVPLSRSAVALLTLPREPGNPLVFAATVPGKPMSPDSMLRVLQAMGHAVTAHGFRSAFSDFAHERTKAEPLLVEAALAHAAGNKRRLTGEVIFLNDAPGSWRRGPLSYCPARRRYRRRRCRKRKRPQPLRCSCDDNLAAQRTFFSRAVSSPKCNSAA
jgi:integrase